ncbi:leucine-rich repeat domain-containing protein [Dysgonomonas sp. GY617]|uniref:leucine-rich repeat domain-containing protein n=1 Tax=Dysgonomonas sp. GY617 TaxID=2780420 RepID=UPI001883BC2A|nr:leucine-rich repeat domain-containing protein [Dysgonomonas sp. GY617]MBF0575989.1 leucine-rich repeat domain-containing protein [Dysgonomonas sp. GY617]
MNNNFFLVILSFFLSITYVQAQLSKTIDVSVPGTLATSLGDEKTKVVELILTGTINDADFVTIKQMSLLKVLNMSYVDIVNGTIPSGTFQNKSYSKLLLPESVTKIGSSAFSGFTMSSTLILPSSVQVIENAAFENVSSLIDIHLAKSSLTTLGGNVFSGKGTPVLDFSEFDLLKNFGTQLIVQTWYGTFSKYTGHVILPNNLEILPNCSFRFYNGSVTLNEGLKTIKAEAFQYANMSATLVLPSTLETIENAAFENVSSLIDIHPAKSSLTTLGGNVFSGKGTPVLDFSEFDLLKNFERQLIIQTWYGTFSKYTGHVILPNNLKILPNCSFRFYNGSVTLNEGLKTIKAEAFQGSNMSATLVLPSTLETIENAAFENVSSLIDIHPAKSSLTTLGGNVFSGKGTPILDFSEFDLLKNFERQLIIQTWYGTFSKYTGHVILPNNLKILPNCSFRFYNGSVTLNEGLKTIKAEAFQGSNILNKTIILPISLVLIETNAFQNCTTLEQITSLNPLPPALGSNVFSGVNKTTCKLLVAEGSVALYKAAAQWQDFLIEEAPRPVQKVSLYYTEDSGQTIKGEYEAVRVGEYYWMNSAFRNEVMTSQTDIASLGSEEQAYINYSWLPNYSIKRSQIDLWHWRAWMFENSDNVAERLSYFEELKGTSDQEKLANIEKYYGTYHSRVHLDWLWLNAIRLEKNSRVRLLEGDTKIYNIWTEPSVQATMQLFAMCGNATRDEIKIYLSDQYNETDNNNPVVIKNRSYMTWFDKTIHNDIAHLANGYKSQYINRYGFNLLPTGDRLNNPAVIQLKDHKTGMNVQYNGVIGDFEGLNQKAVLPMGISYAVLHDYPEIVYTKLYHWAPIRFCRPLTDEELGYKLYINVSGYPDLENYNFLSTLYQNHQNGVFEVKIEKKALGESPSHGFYELPKGYLRGFYVQYKLEYPDDSKTMTDLLRIAQQNPFIFWDKPATDGLDMPDYLPSTRSSLSLESESTNVTIYPNPVTDILYFDSSDSISEVQIYNTSGMRVLNQANVSSSIDMTHLTRGTYILKFKVGDKSYTQKIIKK